MDYKEKYEEALERAKKFYNRELYAECNGSLVEYIFPELKESEDERVRKALIHYFSEQDGILTAINGSVSVGDILAWLEKQGKKIDVIENFDTEFEKQVSHLIASTINKEYEYTSDFVKRTANTLLNYVKHELEKRVEQKSVDKVEQEEDVELTDFESALFSAFSDAWQEYLSGKEVNVAKWTREHSAELLEIAREQKPAWNEEDERNLEGIINEIEANKNNAPDYDLATYDRFLSWLKSLKDRVQPQPKQEWSEEEKARIDKIIDVLDWAEEKGHIHHSDWEDYVCYVKSLKPQNTWKPSDEQMEALWNAIPHIPNSEKDIDTITELSVLYNDLKKLKE